MLHKLVQFRLEDRGSVEDYLKGLKDALDKLNDMSVHIPEDLVILMLLQSLPKEYHFFNRVLQSKDNLPTFIEIESKLLGEEMQVKHEADK